jgi:hypothetical protein
MNYALCIILLIIAAMILTNESNNWSGFEGFEGSEGPLMEFPPDTPDSADLYNNQPYHLLSDEFQPPRDKESLSCVNSRSCYATDFEKVIAKTGSFRQFTNNYKRGYPDSCSAPYQELVLNFYKADPI